MGGRRIWTAAIAALVMAGCDQDVGMGGDADAGDLTDGADSGVDATDAGDVPYDPPYEAWDATDTMDAPEACTRTSSLQLSMLQPDPTYGYLAVDEDHDVLVVIPQYVSGSTDRLMGISLVDGAEQIVSLIVNGDVPLVDVRAVTYDRAAGRSVILAYAMNRPGDGGIGPAMELLTIELDGAGGADMARLEPTSPPPSEGYMFSGVYPEGDGTHYRAFRFTMSSARATVTGNAVSWEPEVALTTPTDMLSFDFELDPTANRLFAYGGVTFEGTYPGPYTEWMEPWAYELSLAGGTVITRIAAAGEPPPRQESLYGIMEAIGLWDDQGSRMVVLQDHDAYDPWIGDYQVTGAWELSAAGVWSVIDEDLMYCCAPLNSVVTDHERRRTLRTTSTGLAGTDLSPGQEGYDVGIDLESALSPGVGSASFDEARGRIVASADAGLISLDVGTGTWIWGFVNRSMTWPVEAAWGHRIGVDGAGDRYLMFGGAHSSTYEETSNVYSLDPGDVAPSWTLAPTTGPTPAPRSMHSMIVDQDARVLYVVGGMEHGGAAYSDHGDVIELDLVTMEWSHLADLPIGRSSAILWLSGDGSELFVIFGEAHPNPADPYTVDQLRDAYRVITATGEVEALTVTGELPTIEARALCGIPLPSGYVIVSPEPFGVRIHGVFVTGSTLDLVAQETCEDPRSMAWGPGVLDPATGTGYLVGRSLWSLSE